eukprot:TRINITY_DN6095_c0_g1_i1.p1 TRINITY_DN6095_c0_g1~~TRINITY_DN6095_c0_g1_i1.p1  ORF type:complete len:257 (+),score=78.00 TRINITY_DN6095_c0_g1_i1:34-804(+)
MLIGFFEYLNSLFFSCYNIMLRFCPKVLRNFLPTASAGVARPFSEHKAKVYTKGGDKGTSQLFNLQRISKDSMFFEAIGNCDELNSCIGVAREFLFEGHKNKELVGQLDELQSVLFDAGAALATPIGDSTDKELERVAFDETNIETLEHWIDEMDAQLPPLTQFVMPSGGLASAHLHLARSTCRRAERSVVPLVRENKVDAAVGRFFNRLSDYLFVSGRFAAMNDGKTEVPWIPRHKRERMAKRQQQKEEAAKKAE